MPESLLTHENKSTIKITKPLLYVYSIQNCFRVIVAIVFSNKLFEYKSRLCISLVAGQMSFQQRVK